MRFSQVTFDDLSDLPAALPKLQEVAPRLLLIFAAPQLIQDPALVQQLRAAMPHARLVGCSTAGEIGNNAVQDNAVVINAIDPGSLEMQIAATPMGDMEDSQGAGERLAQALQKDSCKAVIVLAPGVAINGSALIAGLRAGLLPNTPITGGLAGDNGAFKQTWTLCDEVVSDRQAVAIAFGGEHLGFYHGSFGGWQPFGPARKVTRCRGNELLELDGEPALEVYKRYLGDHAKDLPASGLLFPFAMLGKDHSQIGLIRTILGVNHEQGSLILAGDIEEHGYLKLMHASTDALIDGAQAAADAAKAMYQGDKPGLAILVSCVGRKLVMGARVDEEVEAVADVFGEGAQVTGFYSYGEISPFFDSPECRLHNQTMTITYISD